MDIFKHCVLDTTLATDKFAISIGAYTDSGALTNLFISSEREQYLVIVEAPGIPRAWPSIMPDNEHNNWIAVMLLDKDKIAKRYLDYYAPELVYYIQRTTIIQEQFKIETALTLKLLNEYTDGTI